jgi:predicted heme/steroid binding protein
MSRRAGIIQIAANGVVYDAKGSFSYNLGRPMREAVVGSDTVHGFKETPQVAFIEGEFTDRSDLDLDALVKLENATVTLELANGKTIALTEAWYAGEGTGNTEEGNIGVRFESNNADEVPA